MELKTKPMQKRDKLVKSIFSPSLIPYTKKQREQIKVKKVKEEKSPSLVDYKIMYYPKVFKIKPLLNRRGVKLSSTLTGQRELIREMRNKVNELITYVNNR